MESIRIGNDIKIRVAITPESDLYGLSDFDAAQVRGIRCYLTNADAADSQAEVQVQSDDFRCGPPSYTVEISNPIYDDKRLPTKVLRTLPRVPLTRLPLVNYRYACPVRTTSTEDVIECYFPARDQRYLGTYSLVCVLTLYEEGWGKDNLHTYTVDIGEVFELVDSGGLTGTVTLNASDGETVDEEFVIVLLSNVGGRLTLTVVSTGAEYSVTDGIVRITDIPAGTKISLSYEVFSGYEIAWWGDSISGELGSFGTRTVNQSTTFSIFYKEKE